MTNNYETITDGFGKSFPARRVPLHACYTSTKPKSVTPKLKVATSRPLPRKASPTKISTKEIIKDTKKPVRDASLKKNRPDVRLAQCPLCNRRFGHVATGAELLLKPNEFISKLCDRHGTVVVT